MIVWTIQKPEILGILEETGVYRAETKIVLDNRILAPEVPVEEDFTLVAYRWMSREMSKRIGPPPPGVEFPVWGWYRWGGGKTRPDLRYDGYGPKGMAMVMLEVDIDESRVLLSDFDLWGMPYGGHIIPLPPGVEGAYNRALKAAGAWTRWGEAKVIPPRLQAMKEATWGKVFDLECRATSFTAPVGKKAVQACFWEIRAGWVRGARRFVCR